MPILSNSKSMCINLSHLISSTNYYIEALTPLSYAQYPNATMLLTDCPQFHSNILPLSSF